MKKVLSLFLSFVMLFSCVSFSSIVAYSAQQGTAQYALDQIMTKSGYTPGKQANPANNCYQFISNVCTQLFGVKYDGEGLYDNYKARHQTGNYYTVATYTTQKSYPDSAFADEVIAFFKNNGMSGDVVHYGAYNSSYSKTHTVMIYSVDSKCMKILHSNYGSVNVRLDSIYWDSFKKDPTKTAYNSDDSVYSLNAWLYATMKQSGAGGVGITINRYSKYASLYGGLTLTAPQPTQTTTAQKINLDQVLNVAVTSNNDTSIGITWLPVANATEYYIQIKNKTKGTTFDKTVTTTSTTLNNLTKGNTYTIEIKGKCKNGESVAYSPVLTVTTGNGQLPYVPVPETTTQPTTQATTQSTTTSNKPKKTTAKSLKSSAKGKLTLTWSKSSDASGYQIYWSKDKNFKNVISKTSVSGKSTLKYTGKNFTKGKKYYVKVRAYKKVGSKKYYSAWSKTLSCTSK